MGDSDRMKNYISDYLENSLDPSTHDKFEDALKKSPELRSMTDRVAAVSTHLKNLKHHKCSDEFSIKLREKIHTSSEPLISRQNIVRYSFAASFVIILVLATITIANLMSGSSENTPTMQGSTKIPINKTEPESPVSDANTLRNDKEVNVKSKSTQNTVSDSLGVQQEKKKINRP